MLDTVPAVDKVMSTDSTAIVCHFVPVVTFLFVFVLLLCHTDQMTK